MSRLTLQVAQGASRDWPLQAQNPDGSPSTSFLSSDTLACRVWAGDDQPTLLSPAIAWTDATTASYRVSLQDADTAALAVGVYRIQATATRSGRSGVVLDGRLQVLAAPGSAAAIPVYTTYQDLVDHCAWVGDLQGPESETGFLRQQGLAREWLDEIILNRYKFGNYQLTMGMPGFGAWSVFGFNGDYPPSKYLRDQLALDTLMVYPKVKEIVALRALSYICKTQIGRDDRPYRDLAREYAAEANSLAKCYRAEVDINGDGFADIVVNIGTTDLR